MLTLRILIFLSLMPHWQVFADVLDKSERQISQYISQHQAEQLSLLEQLVNINSGTSNIKGVQQVGEILKTQLKQLGFNTKWVAEPANMHRAPTLIAQHTGNSGRRVLLIGHLDTVFPKDSPFQQFSRHQALAIGPGVIDDKGGDVVILYALKALHAAHEMQDATITVVLTGDEEDSGKPATISRQPLLEAARNSDVALDFEYAISADTATIARRGITDWRLTAQGRQEHSSDIFTKAAGYGAAFELSRIINTMLVQLAKEKYLTFNPGLMLGGTTISYDANSAQAKVFGKSNVIAKSAMAQGDLRYISTEQKLAAEKNIITIVQQHLPGTTASINFIDGIPAMPPSDNNLALLKKYSQVSVDLGYGMLTPLDPGMRGAGDISYVASIVAANLAGLGPLGSGAHSNKETINIDSLVMQTQKAALLIYRLVNEK